MTTNPIINNNSVTLFVGPEADVSALSPEFVLTQGATISPPSGTVRDFNSPQKYTVTAADGVWKKTYTVSVIDTELATNYHFEDTLGGKKYYIFVDGRQRGKMPFLSDPQYGIFRRIDGDAYRCRQFIHRFF